MPPGYRYLGPGNSLDVGDPTNEADALAREHDKAYSAILAAGGRPYTQWSEADQVFFQNLRVNDIPTAVAKGLFGLKKGLNRLGVIGRTGTSFENLPWFGGVQTRFGREIERGCMLTMGLKQVTDQEFQWKELTMMNLETWMMTKKCQI